MTHSGHQPAAPAFRHRDDIDGLRSLAILPILLFHLGVPGFAGGFVGVDIFFVISGALITGILSREMASGTFSVAAFYERRVRRIFPALFVMLAATTLAACLLLLPMDLAAYGRSLMGASGFYANIAFWLQSGYFDTQAELKPLLHTWSLAVEEQYYLIFPLLLYLGFRRNIRPLFIVVGLFILSFALNLWLTPRDHDTSFYLLPTRAWELLLGASLSLGALPAPNKRFLAEVAGLIGLALILGATFTFNSDTSFPGLAAAVPCLGSALILWAGSGEQQGLVTRLLSRPEPVRIGLYSYSLYLWHWPLISLVRYAGHDLEFVAVKLTLAAAFIALSVLSYHLVEAPMRKPRPGLRKWLLSGGIGVSIAFIVLGYALSRDGWPGRYAPALQQMMAGQDLEADKFKAFEQAGRKGVLPESGVLIGNASKAPSIAVWGDSHSGALFATLKTLTERDPALSISTFALGGCRPMLGPHLADDQTSRCHDHNEQVFAYLRDSPEKQVILIARWAVSLYGDVAKSGLGTMNASLARVPGRRLPQADIAAFFVETLDDTVARLQRAGKQVILIDPIIEWPFDVPRRVFQTMARDGLVSHIEGDVTPFKARYEGVDALLDQVATRRPFVRVKPREALCNDWRCAEFADGQLLYTDNSHLSMAGGARLTSQVLQALRR